MKETRTVVFLRLSGPLMSHRFYSLIPQKNQHRSETQRIIARRQERVAIAKRLKTRRKADVTVADGEFREKAD